MQNLALQSESQAHWGYTRREMFFLPVIARISYAFSQSQTRFPELPDSNEVIYAEKGKVCFVSGKPTWATTWCSTKTNEKINYNGWPERVRKLYDGIYGSHSTFADKTGELIEYWDLHNNNYERIFVVSSEEMDRLKNANPRVDLRDHVVREGKKIKQVQNHHHNLIKELVNGRNFVGGNLEMTVYAIGGRIVKGTYLGGQINKEGIESYTRTTYEHKDGKEVPAILIASSDLNGKIAKYLFEDLKNSIIEEWKDDGTITQPSPVIRAQSMHLDTLTRLIGTQQKRSENAIILPSL